MNSIHGYFTDRKFNVLGVASTSLPDAIQIYQDMEIEEIESGVGTFEATLNYKKNNKDQQYNTSFVKVGNFFLFQDEDGNCKWYTIMKTKKDRQKKSIWFYGEDAGLDLLNEIVTEYEADKAYPIAFYINRFTADSGFEVGLNELGTSYQRKLSWEGSSTATERILSVCTQFDHAELSFSFEVSGNRISKKLINIHKKRGSETNIKLSLDRDVENIVTTESILSLRTGLRCVGGTPEGADSPITLSGYSYDDGTYFVKGDKLLNRKANQLWTRYLTESGSDEGYIVGLFEYDTLSQSELCNRAITQLAAASKAEQNFEVSISKLPDNVKIGDTVYIVDADDELYLQARVLKLEKSRSSNKATATLGDYLIKSSNISSKLKLMADEIERNRKQTELVAANGTKVNTGEEEPTSKKLGDIWFRKNADGTVDTVKWDGNAWQAFVRDIEGKALTKKTEQALQDVADARQSAKDAFDKGVEAIAVSKEAELAGERAQEAAELAKAEAQSAKERADSLQVDVSSITSNISAISNDVTTVSSKANEAYSKAQAVEGKTVTLEKSVDGLTGRLTAVETNSIGTTKKLNELEVTVDGQKQTLATVQTTANSALSSANVLETTVNGIKTTVSSVKTTADSALSKATTTETTVNGLKTTISSVETTANSALTKANTAQSTADGNKATISSVKTTADSALSKATQTETTVNGLKTTVTSVQTTANNALTKATQVEQTASGIRQTVTEVQSKLDITDIKTAIASGLVITDDPEFRKGNNGLVVYNNANNGVVTLTRESAVSGGTQPTNSNARMKITVTGAANPQFGGIARPTAARINSKFVVRFTALLPIGRRFMYANNRLGDGARVTWLTSTAGTGLWTEYMYLVECGTGGTFSTFGFLYVLDGTVPTAATPLNWYIARYEIIDISQSQQSQITQLSDNINLKVSKGDVINQINVSTEGVLIDGKKVHITGQTTIDNAVIGTAQIKDAAITNAKISNISASKITAGTLDAGVVNVININADNIKTGKISAIDIVGSSFTNTFSYVLSGVTYRGTTVMRDGNVTISRTGSDGSIWTTKMDRAEGFEDTYQASSVAPKRTTKMGQGKLYMAESGVGGYLPAAALNPAPWVNLSYASGFTTAENNPCQYRKVQLVDGSWELQLRGQIKPTSGNFSTTASPVGGTLPAGFRPIRNELVPAADSTKKGARVVVLASGAIQINTPNGGNYVSLGGIRIAL
ncbi:phage tail spike protein [Enterococcus innesii]|uniref:phage tail spike protein n=1 Tax=Enterococcus innesii TaxID=2839759 RepID=UPI0034A3586F